MIGLTTIIDSAHSLVNEGIMEREIATSPEAFCAMLDVLESWGTNIVEVGMKNNKMTKEKYWELFEKATPGYWTQFMLDEVRRRYHE